MSEEFNKCFIYNNHKTSIQGTTITHKQHYWQCRYSWHDMQVVWVYILFRFLASQGLVERGLGWPIRQGASGTGKRAAGEDEGRPHLLIAAANRRAGRAHLDLHQQNCTELRVGHQRGPWKWDKSMLMSVTDLQTFNSLLLTSVNLTCITFKKQLKYLHLLNVRAHKMTKCTWTLWSVWYLGFSVWWIELFKYKALAIKLILCTTFHQVKKLTGLDRSNKLYLDRKSPIWTIKKWIVRKLVPHW